MTKQNWEKELFENSLYNINDDNVLLEFKQEWLVKFIKKLLAEERARSFKKILLDQLYRVEGILGKYNCQHGGMKCNFQTNCHRLIRKEIEIIKKV